MEGVLGQGTAPPLSRKASLIELVSGKLVLHDVLLCIMFSVMCTCMHGIRIAWNIGKCTFVNMSIIVVLNMCVLLCCNVVCGKVASYFRGRKLIVTLRHSTETTKSLTSSVVYARRCKHLVIAWLIVCAVCVYSTCEHTDSFFKLTRKGSYIVNQNSAIDITTYVDNRRPFLGQTTAEQCKDEKNGTHSF